MKRLLVLTSGRGSNFRAILETATQGLLRAEVVALGVSKKGIAAEEVAVEAGIPVLNEPTEDELLKFVQAEKIDAVILAGYMRIVSSRFIDSLRNSDGLSRILNIHPSLLPAFPGLNAYQQAFDYGVRETGVSVHLVEPKVDGGPILDQRSFRIDDLNEFSEVEARGLSIEHALYSRTIDWFVNGKYRIEKRGGRSYVIRL